MLCTYISALSRYYQIEFFWHQMEQIQRPTEKHYAERPCKLKYAIVSPSSETGEPCGRGGGKIIGDKGVGRYQDNMAPEN